MHNGTNSVLQDDFSLVWLYFFIIDKNMYVEINILMLYKQSFMTPTDNVHALNLPFNNVIS